MTLHVQTLRKQQIIMTVFVAAFTVAMLVTVTGSAVDIDMNSPDYDPECVYPGTCTPPPGARYSVVSHVRWCCISFAQRDSFHEQRRLMRVLVTYYTNMAVHLKNCNVYTAGDTPPSMGGFRGFLWKYIHSSNCNVMGCISVARSSSQSSTSRGRTWRQYQRVTMWFRCQ